MIIVSVLKAVFYQQIIDDLIFRYTINYKDIGEYPEMPCRGSSGYT